MFSNNFFSRRASLAFFLLLPINISYATDFYVSPTGDDLLSGSSASDAWKTIARANQAVGPGDTVFLMGGVYVDDPIKPAVSGEAGERIHYQAYQNQVPVLTSLSVGGLDIAIDLTDRHYITVRGIHVDGHDGRPNARVGNFVVIYDGSYNVIEDCDFRYAHGWRGIDIDGESHHNKILDSVMDFVGIYADENNQDIGDLLVVGYFAHHNLIEGNLLTHGPHGLMRLDGYFNVVRNNVFDNDWSTLMGPGTGGRNLELMGRRNLFELNIVRNSGTSIDDAGNAGMKAEQLDNIVRKNLILNNQEEGISSSARDGREARHNHIFHNTIVGSGGEGWRLELFNGGVEPVGNIFKNNLVFGRTEGPVDIRIKLALSSTAPLGDTVIENNLIARSVDGDARIFIEGDGNNQSMVEAEQRFPGIRGNIFSVPQFAVQNPIVFEDFDLIPGSPGVDQAAPLTVAEGSGSGTVISVEDAGYFSDGFSLISGDDIRVNGAAPVRILSVDYANNQLTLARAISWQSGAPVTLDYSGAAPDVGAREAGDSLTLDTRPNPPQLIIVDNN